MIIVKKYTYVILISNLLSINLYTKCQTYQPKIYKSYLQKQKQILNESLITAQNELEKIKVAQLNLEDYLISLQLPFNISDNSKELLNYKKQYIENLDKKQKHLNLIFHQHETNLTKIKNFTEEILFLNQAQLQIKAIDNQSKIESIRATEHFIEDYVSINNIIEQNNKIKLLDILAQNRIRLEQEENQIQQELKTIHSK